MEKDIQHERTQLQEVIEKLDERLIDFKTLLVKATAVTADYSTQSMAAVEKLLYKINPDKDNDSHLLIEASLYIGECYRIMADGKWDVAEDIENWGKPEIICNKLNSARLFPFDIISEYLEDPKKGFLLNTLNNYFSKTALP